VENALLTDVIPIRRENFYVLFPKIFDPIHAEKVVCIGIVFMVSFCKSVTLGQESQVFSVINLASLKMHGRVEIQLHAISSLETHAVNN
jgi:hypothetical protein